MKNVLLRTEAEFKDLPHFFLEITGLFGINMHKLYTHRFICIHVYLYIIQRHN